jgi:predicted Zn-dependent protease
MIVTFRFGLQRTLLIIFLTICFVWTLSAQIAGGLNETNSTDWGGNNYIAGTIFFPDGTRVNMRLPIRLRSQIKGEIMASTDDSGRFVFSRLSNGVYTVSFAGDQDFESVSQDVEIELPRSSLGQTFTMMIRLKYKSKSDLKPGVINSKNANVPKKALEFYNKGVELARSKDNKGAIKQLKLAVAEYPDFVNAFNELGIQYMIVNDLEKAEESLRSALKIKPDAVEPLMNLGIVLFRLKKFNDAEPVLRSALKIDEKSAIGHFYLGRLLTRLEHYDEAEKELNLAMSLSENKMIEVHRMLANVYLGKDDYKRAADELETYLRLNPTAQDADKLRAVLAQLKGVKSP